MLVKVKTTTCGKIILKSSMVNIKVIKKRNVTAVLYIAALKPTLNVKEKSVRLELYN